MGSIDLVRMSRSFSKQARMIYDGSVKSAKIVECSR